MTTRGIVIGAGGVTGLAWSSATLAALEQATGWDPREADVLLGTSQGALLASLLACEIGTADLTGWYRRELPDGHPLRTKPSADRPTTRRRLPVPASPLLPLRALMPPGRVPATVALSGLLPTGTRSLDAFVAPLTVLAEPDGWVPHEHTMIVAVDYDSGARTAFGTASAPRTGVLDAVRASCTVPGVYPATTIGRRRYVDGGVHSTTSLDLLTPLELDEVYVLAPMAGTGSLTRRLIQRGLDSEARQVRRTGTRIHLLTPTSEDRTAMGRNPLDPRHRIATFETALRTGPGRIAAVLP
ncbi:NTE family protein [Herbihabitans rhizosphaerae]|uniref:NTE family protein n=1 Tax=Herbihabitans rhizosphaerae TaxID=1872711 RepID=A0A4Q7L0Z7_9PSEU|nr:patatin-like phospholipase family protein [Herbihabitans rhizosphaerae]RZS43158.1 NTE family protein [Herbihabitans rhizosphaerae]